MFGTLRRRLITGFLAVLPAIFTIWALMLLVSVADGISQPLVRWITGERIPGLGLVLTMLSLYIVGGLVPHDIVGRLIEFFERLFGKVPLAGAIYSAAKQTIEALRLGFGDQKFNRVVWIQYPRPGVWTLGFVTHESLLQNRNTFAVFIPTTPNPTSGMLVMVDRSETAESTMSIEEGVKFIVSGGVIAPEGRDLAA